MVSYIPISLELIQSHTKDLYYYLSVMRDWSYKGSTNFSSEGISVFYYFDKKMSLSQTRKRIGVSAVTWSKFTSSTNFNTILTFVDEQVAMMPHQVYDEVVISLRHFSASLPTLNTMLRVYCYFYLMVTFGNVSKKKCCGQRSMQLMAQDLGMTRQNLNRIVNDLISCGLIERFGKYGISADGEAFAYTYTIPFKHQTDYVHLQIDADKG